MAEGTDHQAGPGPQLLDADELIDEILARKGPAKYKDGLTEDNWEEVCFDIGTKQYESGFLEIQLMCV